jgi:hypothetical protein
MPYIDPEDQRSAVRRHYARNSEAMKKRAAIHKVAARLRNAAYVAGKKTDMPCTDCGISYHPCVMQFDHIADNKDRAVANLVNQAVSIARLQAEIDKCELVCANCHSIRTYERRMQNS